MQMCFLAYAFAIAFRHENKAVNAPPPIDNNSNNNPNNMMNNPGNTIGKPTRGRTFISLFSSLALLVYFFTFDERTKQTNTNLHRVRNVSRTVRCVALNGPPPIAGAAQPQQPPDISRVRLRDNDDYDERTREFENKTIFSSSQNSY